MAAPIIQAGNGLLYPALRKAGVTLGPGRTPSDAQFEDALQELNRLVGSLNCDRLFIYSVSRREFPLDPVKASYTIGISSDPLAPADFAVARPQWIESANIIDPGNSNPIRYALTLPSDIEWSQLAYQTLPNTIPEAIYNDRAYPLSTLYLYGQPMSGHLLELYTWQIVPAFTSVNDRVELPPGYEDAITLNLAVRLAPHFQRPVDPNVRADARESLMRLESINAPRPIAEVGGLGCCGDGFNIYTG